MNHHFLHFNNYPTGPLTYVYVVVNFLSQVIFIFLLFQLHQHILPYPKTKEKQKLPEMKN